MTNPKKSILRVIDANINRLKEGIRVVEDIQRYIFDDALMSKKLKTLRHQASSVDIDYHELMTSRDVGADVLRTTTSSESSRPNIDSILIANFKRIQESSRVLEEVFKLIDVSSAEVFKNIRYECYIIEKELLGQK